MAIWTDSVGNTHLPGGPSLTVDEIQKMKDTSGNADDFGRTLDEIKAARGGFTPKDMHRVITKEKILDDAKWGKSV